MELPSMVERSGDRLVVRSLVSGAPVYQTPIESGEEIPTPLAMGASFLERQLEQYRMSSLMLPMALPVTLSLPHTLPQTLPQALPVSLPAPVSLPQTNVGVDGNLDASPAEGQLSVNEGDLPQCKIRRNYSCNQCSFFTQNPRSHLSHLRDVHGERIVINECKLCLYASRHFQKLVRHMKMVHGCSDDAGAAGSGGQQKGKRNLSREARKRRLEESVEAPSSSMTSSMNPNLLKMLQSGPSLEQLKTELQQQEQQLLTNVQAYNRQQEMQQLQQIVDSHDNIFSMAFEFQLRLMPSKQQSMKLEATHSSSDSEEATQSPTSDALELPPGVEQFQCHKCSYSTPVRARFTKHVKYHTMPLIKCSWCDFHTPYKWNLDRHTKNHGAHGHFRCSVCDFSTDIKQSLTIHELNHHVPTVGHQLAARRRAEEEHEEQKAEQQPRVSRRVEIDVGPPHPVTAPDSPQPELNGINCSNCQQIVPSALDLIKHLQTCGPAQKSTSQQSALPGDMDPPEEELPIAANDLSYCGVETAPGYGEVTEQFPAEDADDFKPLKKVFKCPHCTFWAATASRFHVHIVGHLNRKPFECSLCAYRSNWRWDITKHIRLKAIRDKSHNQAQVLMNDETGRRNYAKYNQYLTLMKVNADQVGDVKAMRRGEMVMVAPEKIEEHVLAPCEAMDINPTPSTSKGAFEASALDLSKPKSEQPMETGMDMDE
ncbi:hypothetical protein KR009_007870, partial [Drosophila setifemur]